MEETEVVNIRDHKNWKAEGGVYIGRGFRGQRGSTFANPFKIGADGDRDTVIEKYKKWISARLKHHSGVAEEFEGLRGKMLVCWCAPEPCHGDVLVELLERLKAE